MPKRESSWHRPTCPSPSEFHCGSTNTARRGPPGPTSRAGKNRVTTTSFSRCKVGRAVGNVTREVPSPSLATTLTRPVAALSFEYVPAAHGAALDALEVVEALGRFEYNYSPVETMQYAAGHWLNAAELVDLLDGLRPLGRSGDIYAQLVPGP